LLSKGWQGGELDLSDTLIIVPTAESARRLKEALARAAAVELGAVSAPHVWPPERALLTNEDRENAASDTQALLAWTRVLLDAPLGRMTHLFPIPPAQQNWSWAVEMARALMDMSKALGAGGFNFADVAAFDELPRDRERWVELETLEKMYHAVLASQGVQDMQHLKRLRAATPQLPKGVRQVIVLPSPDLPALFKRWLDHVADEVNVTMHVQAPASLSDHFDAHGTPLRTHWGEKCDIAIPITSEQIHLEHDPAEQAKRVLELLRELAPEHRVAVGVADMEVVTHLEDRLQQEDVRIYEPGGVRADRHGTVQLLARWADLVNGDDWQSFAALLRMPEARDVLAECRGAFATRVMEAADEFAAKHLPVTVTHALEMIDGFIMMKGEHAKAAQHLKTALFRVRELVQSFARQSLHEAARALILQLYGEQLYQADAPQHRDHVRLCSDWLRLCEELDGQSRSLQLKAPGNSLLSLSIDWLKQQQLTDPRGEIDLVLMGWLELLWEPSPALILAGFNEESVPGILISHPFLPDQLREALNIACQASRFARDAYLLRALAEQRQSSALHLTCGLWSEGKDALRPSRLLFLCEDKQLVSRVRHLFPKEVDAALPKEPARQRAWKLKPAPMHREPLAKISASRLRSYLACPFRYYLDHVLHMGAVEAAPAELNAMAYGNLIHEALAVLQSDEGKRCASDEASIAGLLLARIEALAHRDFGKRLPVPVQLQLDGAMQRLRAAATVEAELRVGGWRTEASELRIGDDDEHPALMLGSARFHGIVDRIDTNGGHCRIIDYKTADKPEPPLKTHLQKIKNPDALEEDETWKTFHHSATGATYQWQDLQLPLYAKAWSLRTKAEISAAYFNLPKAIDQTKLDPFPELDAEMMDAAVACAEEAVRRINAGIFWPPSAPLREEDYPGLVHGVIEEAFDAANLNPVA
jgi:ATP-dependent helicase/nuclease subunit B